MMTVMRSLVILLLLTALKCVPAASPSSSLVFSEKSSGYAELGDVPVDGTLTVSLSFRTVASEGLLLYMREISAGHHVTLFLSEGVLHLQIHSDSIINLVSKNEKTGEKVRMDDNQWHDVLVFLNKWPVIVFMKIDDSKNVETVQFLPQLDDTSYETFIGGVRSESETPFVGCLR